MRRIPTVLFLCITTLTTFSQVNTSIIADSITKEGKKLYESETASWYGTDIFMDQFKADRGNIGGYFSYRDGTRETCLFFSKGDDPLVLGTIGFENIYDIANATIDSTKRKFTDHENQIYQLRNAAYDQIKTDTAFFKTYRNTNLNLIPFVENEERTVYILTGTSRTDIVIIGNDYLLKFDKDNKLISKKSLHANIIPLNYATKDEKKGEGAVHTHLPETGDFMTATDVCTFMLYEKIANWKQQMVISEKYMSIWNCESDHLTIIPMH